MTKGILHKAAGHAIRSCAEHLRINEAKWDRWARTLDGTGRRSRYLRRAQEAVLAMVDIKEDMRFLDVGCGTGWAVGRVAALTGGRGLFCGADLSSKMIGKAVEKFRGSRAARFLVADAAAVPLRRGSFDTVICTYSFHHYLNPEKALTEFYRLLRPGGRLFLLDPTADTWFMRLADRVGRCLEPAHVRLYSTEDFRGLFTDAGLRYSSADIPAPRRKVHMGEKAA